MEKWKIGVIAALVLSLIGFGIYQQGADGNNGQNPPGAGTPTARPTPSRYLGMTIGSEGKQIPEWTSIKTWMNVSTPPTLSSLKGSVSLVEVFRIECPHCQDAAPLMQKLYERYKPRGFKMVTIQSPGDYKTLSNPEIDWTQVQSWVTQRGLKYPVGFDKDSKWFQGKLNGDYYPTILVFDKSGKVVLTFSGHDDAKFINMVVTIEKLLGGKGSIKERSLDVAKWLNGLLQGPDAAKDPVMNKAMSEDLEQRLK